MMKEASKDFAEFVDELDGDAVLVEIYTPLCGPCQEMKKNVLPEVEGKVEVLTINAITNPAALAMIQNDIGSITLVPVLVLYRNGRLVGSHRGVMNLDELEKFIGESQ